MNEPSTRPELRSFIGERFTYRPDLPPYEPAAADETYVVANGQDVVIVEAFDDWNDVDGLIIFAVFVPATGEHTHLSASEMGFTITNRAHQEPRAA